MKAKKKKKKNLERKRNTKKDRAKDRFRDRMGTKAGVILIFPDRLSSHFPELCFFKRADCIQHLYIMYALTAMTRVIMFL